MHAAIVVCYGTIPNIATIMYQFREMLEKCFQTINFALLFVEYCVNITESVTCVLRPESICSYGISSPAYFERLSKCFR